MSPLHRYHPMSSRSDHYYDDDYQEVYARVDARSDKRCEVALDGFRCIHAAVEHHHTVKPRRSNHAPELVIAICRAHHDRCDWPYKRGRLVIRAKGDGTFDSEIVTAPDKFTLRERADGLA